MSDKFTPSQKSNTVLWYGVCGDTDVVRNKFKAVYGDEVKEVPSASEIREWYKNFRHIGFVDSKDAVIHEEATGEPVNGDVAEHHSKLSTMFSNVLNKLNTWFLDGPKIRTFHPYHMELITFDREDLEERKKFAQNQLDHFHKWAPVLKTMWFTGEARFYLDGHVECHNLVYTNFRKTDDSINWPHRIVRNYSPPDAPYVTVWAAMNSELMIGPFFFDGDLTSDAYKESLKKFVEELRPITSSLEHPIFIHDDSKIHTDTDVTAYLEEQFPHHWIGTGSSYGVWPHHSPDLSPINYFLWGYLKSRVFKTELKEGGLEELKRRIQDAFKNVTSDLLEESVEEYKTRLERVVKYNGDLVDASIYGFVVDFDKLNAWSMYAWPYI